MFFLSQNVFGYGSLDQNSEIILFNRINAAIIKKEIYIYGQKYIIAIDF